MLLPYYYNSIIEVGCDEAGRGPLAGAVFAAAVIFPQNIADIVALKDLNDSKQLSEKQRYLLRPLIEKNAMAWSVAMMSPKDIDTLNILKASILAMHEAIHKLKIIPQHIIVDGNKWIPYKSSPKDVFGIPCHTIVKGDSKYMSIAAASVLAKTYRDDYMNELDKQYPMYHWKKNKGYPTKEHYEAIRVFGLSPYHRQSFHCLK